MNVLDHWTPEDHRDVELSATMAHLAVPGIRMLRKLRQESPSGKVYLLSGPMTTGGFGNFEQNMMLFEHAIEIARENGMCVFNQLPFQTGMIRLIGKPDNIMFDGNGLPYPQNILDDFYWPLFECGELTDLLLFPTWTGSNGSTQEFTKALDLGISIEEYDPDWFEEALRRTHLAIQHKGS